MSRKMIGTFAAARTLRRGMTLLEILIVMAMISAMLAVMTPALIAGRGEARVSTCLSNLRGIAVTAGFYSQDHGRSTGTGVPALPWFMSTTNYSGVQWVSTYVYGGFRHTMQSPLYMNSDTYIIPTENRPFNKYIAPGIGGRSPIKQYVCPSDAQTAMVDVGDPGHIFDVGFSSWEFNGNSYPINWYWMQGTPNPDYDLDVMHAYGSATLQGKTGAAACKFVVFMEAAMEAYMMDARPSNGSMGQSELQQLGKGWHGRYSTYCMAMWDGHAEYRYVDTRYTDGPNYNTWPEPGTPWPY